MAKFEGRPGWATTARRRAASRAGSWMDRPRFLAGSEAPVERRQPDRGGSVMRDESARRPAA